jgi:hypothetical protein
MTSNKDFIENLEQFTRVHHEVSDSARQIGDLANLYGELLAYQGYVEARYPQVHKEAMLCAERIAQARVDRELEREVS